MNPASQPKSTLPCAIKANPLAHIHIGNIRYHKYDLYLGSECP
jgi:hypothetical protein